ncbi:unnamed protein product [Peronospora destructor]|uniref:Peroxin-14 n=1 Tax=Peronospora destructor TaxID=86335 RepID=A0AAV0TQE0_9STRA|nr:unnamed protein product [Peronospora destructor]
MREDQVVSGLKFLQHPKVQATPLSERVSFLEGKGLSKEEIQEAIERHQNGGDTRAFTDQSTTQQQQQMKTTTTPVMMTANVPMHQTIHHRGRYPAYIQVLWTVSSLVGAASIVTFLWNYAVQSGYIPWLRPMPYLFEAAKVQEEKQKEAKKDDVLLAELTSVSAAIQKQTEELAKMSLSLDEKERDLHNKTLLSAQISSSLAQQGNAQSIAELKAEMSTLKALLLSKTTENASGLDTIDVVKKNSEDTEMKRVLTISETASTSNNTQPAVVLQTVSKAERMQKALKKLRTENSFEQLKLAAGILSMYVKNLVENPDVPRYRRIALGNANFKQKIEPLKHHEELLKSIGFETSGINMEWKWYTASKTTGAFDENIAILRAMLKALQSLSSPNASSNLSLEEIAHASLDDFFSQQDKKNTEMLTTATKTSITSSNIIEEKRSAVQSGSSASLGRTSTNLEEFMARLEQQTNVGNTANTDVSMTNPLSQFSATNVSDGEEKMFVSASSSISPTVTAGGPPAPESFKEVMDLIRKGETVPGIRNIEEKLSVDSSTLLSERMEVGETTVVKPWGKIEA